VNYIVAQNNRLSGFIGLAPSDQPKYAIAVLIETPHCPAATEAEEIGREVWTRSVEDVDVAIG
jgi:cell division protein FtsI/penicillin-binding protein 2